MKKDQEKSFKCVKCGHAFFWSKKRTLLVLANVTCEDMRDDGSVIVDNENLDDDDDLDIYELAAKSIKMLH